MPTNPPPSDPRPPSNPPPPPPKRFDAEAERRELYARLDAKLTERIEADPPPPYSPEWFVAEAHRMRMNRGTSGHGRTISLAIPYGRTQPAPPEPTRRPLLTRLWRWFLARFRLSLDAVCEESAGRGLVDFHDYPDGDVGEPWHFYTHTCQRCGKRFTI